MLRGELERGSVGTAEHNRHPNLPARHVEHFRGRIHDLVEREQRKVPRHELDHRAEPAHRGADADAGESKLGDGRIDDALGAELLEQSPAHLVRALIDADFLTHQEDVGIALHLFAQRLIQGVSIRESGHRQSASTSRYSSSGSGSGLSSANFTAASTSAWISASIASRAASSMAPSSLSFWARWLMGSRAFCSSTSSLVRYTPCRGSDIEWPMNRYVRTSSSVGWLFLRARSTARRVASYTVSAFMPSTSSAAMS